MATALDLISSALRLINVQAAGEPTPIDMANDALAVLNDMIDSWNTDRLSIYTTRSDDFPFVLGQQAYTLGAGGDFDMARPAAIDAVSSIIFNPDPTNPVEQPIPMWTWQQWQTEINVKKTPGSIPLGVYDDGGFPLRTLNFWPIPTDQPGNKARIYSWQALTQPATLATAIAVPPGYRKAFRFNLAVDLAAEFAQPLPAVVAEQAASSLAMVKTLNAPDLLITSDLTSDPAGYNYQADMFGLPYGPL